MVTTSLYAKKEENGALHPNVLKYSFNKQLSTVSYWGKLMILPLFPHKSVCDKAQQIRVSFVLLTVLHVLPQKRLV